MATAEDIAYAQRKLGDCLRAYKQGKISKDRFEADTRKLKQFIETQRMKAGVSSKTR